MRERVANYQAIQAVDGPAPMTSMPGMPSLVIITVTDQFGGISTPCLTEAPSWSKNDGTGDYGNFTLTLDSQGRATNQWWAIIWPSGSLIDIFCGVDVTGPDPTKTAYQSRTSQEILVTGDGVQQNLQGTIKCFYGTDVTIYAQDGETDVGGAVITGTGLSGSPMTGTDGSGVVAHHVMYGSATWNASCFNYTSTGPVTIDVPDPGWTKGTLSVHINIVHN